MKFDEAKILEAIGNGDESAFRILFDEFYDDLCNYLKYFIRDFDAIEDLVQEVFVNFWRHRSDLPEIRSLKGYLYSSVKNKLLDYRKHLSVRIKAAERIGGLFSDINSGRAGNYEETELQEFLDNAIGKLPFRRREVFILVKINGMSYREAADTMNISVKTVERQLSIATKTLRDILTPFMK